MYIPGDLVDPTRGVAGLDITDTALDSASVDLIIGLHAFLEHVKGM